MPFLPALRDLALLHPTSPLLRASSAKLSPLGVVALSAIALPAAPGLTLHCSLRRDDAAAKTAWDSVFAALPAALQERLHAVGDTEAFELLEELCRSVSRPEEDEEGRRGRL